MAGFPKFPIPRYLNSSLWLLNRNWRNNFKHLIIPSFFIVFMMCRTVSLTLVIELNIIFLKFSYFCYFCFFVIFQKNVTPDYGHYLDPEEHDAPKKIAF